MQGVKVPDIINERLVLYISYSTLFLMPEAIHDTVENYYHTANEVSEEKLDRVCKQSWGEKVSSASCHITLHGFGLGFISK